MGFANLFYKTMVAYQAWAFCSIATLCVFARDRRIQLIPKAWRFSAPAAITLVIAFVLLMHGLALGPASVLVPVAQMGFVFTALLGAAIFRERLTMRKRLGLFVAVAALALFAVS